MTDSHFLSNSNVLLIICSIFVPFIYTFFRWCEYCQSFIFGVMKQGYICERRSALLTMV